jgi:UDP-N-acetylmuramoyl-tripeptide--D-alanyl-D-alanine ligase
VATPIPINGAAFSLDELTELPGAALVVAAETERATSLGEAFAGVAIDSRIVVPGGIFVAIRGDTHDGHDHCAPAVQRGAGVLLVDRNIPTMDAATIKVPDTRKALRDLASLHLRRWRTKDKPVFCVTGSSGKTTTKEMLAALVSARVPVCKTHGNLNNLIGVPMMALTLGEHRAAVFEAGMSIPGEMDLLAALLTPDVSTIVNVGLAHAEGVGGPDGIAHEKGAVYQHLAPGGVVVANADDPRAKVARAGTATLATFGDAGEYRLASRTLVHGGVRCVIKARARTLTLSLPVFSPAQITDLLCALACAESRYGEFGEEEITAAMHSLKLEGRATIESLKDGITLIDDAYNANPESMREAIRLLVELGQGRRRVAIVGDMRELGTYSVGAHQALADQLHAADVSLVIGCGTEVEETLSRLAHAGTEVLRANDAEEAGKLALSRVLSMDVVLVKASRGIALDRACAVLRKGLPR